jgi:ActD protein
MANNDLAFGIYLTRRHVEAAIIALKNEGFSSAEVSILFPESLRSKEEVVTEKNTKAPEVATVGAGSGAVIGGALGWLVGVGALVIPGIGPFIAAGPLVATLAGIGVGSALGGFAGALIGVGIPEHEAKKYEVGIMRGGILLALHCDTPEKTSRARNILQITGAEDIMVSTERPTDRNTSAA